MSYQVLARKWRPANFHELVGQQHVKKALITALDGERLHHAYLFTGTRGVGKTTIARILSKCLNCVEGVSSTPCGSCSSCTAIAEGRFVDLIEVDAASRTKVDDTRELLDNVQYRPTEGRYKVYLIDEVHMLSTHSFNAWLKTLEEPPPHVIFLLATTDPQKLPVTVLSRCLQFHLRHMSEDEISTHLGYILGEEKVEFETPALELLAAASDGSMRDGLSLLDQAMAHGAGAVNEVDVKEMLGTVERAPIWDLIESIAANNETAVFAAIDKLSEFSSDFEPVLEELLHALHELALAQKLESIKSQLSPQAQALSEQLQPEDIQLFYQIALHGRRDLPLAASSRMGFEMTLLRLMAFQPEDPLAAQKKTEKNVDASASSQTKEIKPQAKVEKIVKTAPPQATEISEPKPATAPVSKITASADNWAQISASLKLEGMARQMMINSKFVSVSDNQLVASCANLLPQACTPERQQQITQAVSAALGYTVAVKIEAEIDSQGSGETAMEVSHREASEKQLQATDTFEKDSLVKDVLSKFDGTIRQDSIKSLTD